MTGLDTNVLVRFLVQDDPRQSRLATRFVERRCTVESPGFVTRIVLCELCWVLESCYGLDRAQVASVLQHLLEVRELEIEGAESAWRALADFRESGADFSDHLLARTAQEFGAVPTATLDRRAGKHPLFELLD